MNRHDPTVLNGLAREYALGTMSARVRRRFEVMLRRSSTAAHLLIEWQEHLAKLESATTSMRPSPYIREQLQARLFGGVQKRNPARQSWLQRLMAMLQAWPTVLSGAMLACALLVSTVNLLPGTLGLEPGFGELPESYVGVLSDVKGSGVLLVSSRRHGKAVNLKVLQPLVLPPGHVARLWAFSTEGKAAFAVGIVPPQKGKATLALADTAENLFFKVATLGVRIEPINASHLAPPKLGELLLQGPCGKLW